MSVVDSMSRHRSGDGRLGRKATAAPPSVIGGSDSGMGTCSTGGPGARRRSMTPSIGTAGAVARRPERSDAEDGARRMRLGTWHSRCGCMPGANHVLRAKRPPETLSRSRRGHLADRSRVGRCAVDRHDPLSSRAGRYHPIAHDSAACAQAITTAMTTSMRVIISGHLQEVTPSSSSSVHVVSWWAFGCEALRPDSAYSVCACTGVTGRPT